MAHKTALSNPKSLTDSASRSRPPSAGAKRAIPLRIVALLALLVVVAGVGLAMRGTELRMWWLSRQSMETLRKAAADESSDAVVRYVYAKKLFTRHHVPEALEAFQATEKALPPNAHDMIAQQTLAHLGYMWMRSGNEKEAAGYLKRAQEMNDDDPLVHLGLGLLFMHRKQRNYAENQFKIVVHTNPSITEGWYLLGKNYAEMSSFNMAEEPLQEAIKLDPKNATYWGELGSVYGSQRKFDKAIPAFRKGCELAPNDIRLETLLGAAMALDTKTQQEYQEAVAVLEDCIRRAPDDDNAELSLGTLHMRFKNLPQARKHFRNLVMLAPNQEGGWFKLAQVEQMLGHKAAHDQAIKRFNELFGFGRTMTVLTTKLGADPKNSARRLDVAHFLWQHGNLHDALGEYEALLINEPNNAAVRHEFQEREKEYKAALAKDPNGDYSHLKSPPFIGPLVDSPDDSNQTVNPAPRNGGVGRER